MPNKPRRPETKNDIAWDKLFEKYRIDRQVQKHGFYEITSTQINEFREARLMTKFDHRKNLPILFDYHNLSILPITRGSYVIADFEAYHDFEKPSAEILKVSPPDFVQSIDFQNITSEATAINVAYISGILADFVQDEALLPTVNGRMSSEAFDFDIYNRTKRGAQGISVVNSQLEIDGGFEGLEYLTLLEAKNSLSKDFLVRQLYYPYRLWNGKVDKQVKPVFLTYTNGVFNLYEYQFADPHNYNSLVLTNQKNYTLEQDEISLDDVMALVDVRSFEPEPQGVPFPQADSFDRVINICELIYENGYLTRDYTTYNYDFDVRQTNYYTDAARYLGLVYKDRTRDEGIRYFLTPKGERIFKLNYRQRNLAFAKCILSMKAFNWTFRAYLNRVEMPSRQEIVKIMSAAQLQGIGPNTMDRRASSIKGWLNWLIDLTR